MKKISIVIPVYNEEENIVPLYEELLALLGQRLSKYDYEIIFIDNKSKDTSREKILSLCTKDKKVKAIFNVRNFGQFNSPYYGLTQSTGDCTVLMCADFQDPPEMLLKFIEEWEKGFKIVVGVKTVSKENPLMYFFRSCYYKLIKKISDVEQIEHFTGFGLYDRTFIETLKNLDDPNPYLRGIVAELGPERKEVPYEQPQRRAGKTSNDFYRLYDAAMLGLTSYTKNAMRLATILGFIFAGITAIIGLVYFILKMLYWDSFSAGMAPLIMGIFLIGSVQLVFIGILGEYILSINSRVMKRPLVVEDERINFTENNNNQS